MLTESDQARWAATNLTGTGIVMYPKLLDAPVIRYRSSLLLGRVTFLATYSHLRLPLCLEDGFCVAEVKMKKENGVWKLELPIVHWR